MPLLGGGAALSQWILAGGAEVGAGPTPPAPSGAIDVEVDGKHPALIAVAMQYVNADGNTVWGTPQVFTYDVPLLARITSISLRYLGTGEVIPNVHGDEDVVAIYGNVGIGAPPSDPTAVVYDFTVPSNQGEPGSTGRFATFGDVVYVAARGVDKNGVLGPVKLVGFHRGDASKHAPKVHATAIRSGETVTITIEVDDATRAVTSVQHKKREGNGALDTSWQDVWDLGSTGVVGSDTYLKRIRALTAADGLDNEFHWRVEYTNENGTTEEIGDSITLANLREVSKTIRLPHTSFVPRGTADSYDRDDSYVYPTGGVGVQAIMYASIVLGRGVELTEARLRSYRAAAGEAAVLVVFRQQDTGGPGGATILATVTASTGYQTTSGALSETVGSDGYSLVVTLSQASGTDDDARLFWVEIDYDVPSYEFTI